MAVTRLRLALGAIATWILLVIGFQNCAVDMNKNTYGASSVSLSCTSTAVELAAFEPVLNNTLQSTGTVGGGKQACGSCHNSTANNVGKNSFTIFPGNTTSDPTLIQTNLCAVKTKGPRTATQPQAASHGGGQYNASEIQDLVNFVDTYVQ